MKNHCSVNLIFLMICLEIIVPGFLKAQPKYNFSHAQSLCAPGTGCLTQGSKWIYQNVSYSLPQLDAIVTIDSISPGAAIDLFDNDASTYPEAFAPQILVKANKTGFVSFNFQLVLHGTLIPAVQDSIPLTAIDIDGANMGAKTLQEFDGIDLHGGYSEFLSNTPELLISNNGTTVTARNTSSIDHPGIDTVYRPIMITAVNHNISSFEYTCGAINNFPVDEVRLKAIYPTVFNYDSTKFIFLPIQLHFINPSCVPGNAGNELRWQTETSNQISNFIIEYGTNGSDFSAIGSLMPSSDFSTPYHTYSFVDSSGRSNIFYRIQMFMNNGEILYSPVIHITGNTRNSDFLSVFPNPSGNNLNLVIISEQRINGSISIYNREGKMLLSKEIKLEAGRNNLLLDLSSVQATQALFLVLHSEAGKTATRQLLFIR